MHEMIERVAQGLMRRRHHMDKPAFLTVEKAGGILLPRSIQQANWEECVGDARAALEAMRYSTDDMDAAADALVTEVDGVARGAPSEIVWSTMVDAVLAVIPGNTAGTVRELRSPAVDWAAETSRALEPMIRRIHEIMAGIAKPNPTE